MKDFRKIAITTVPVAILIIVVLIMITGCKDHDDVGKFGFTIDYNEKLKVVFSDPIFRQIGYQSNDPYSKYLAEVVGLEYYDQQYLIDLIKGTSRTLDIASTDISNPEMAAIMVGLATRGVQIRVVTEKSNFDYVNPNMPEQIRAVQQQLIDAGVQVRTDHDDANRLMHSRYMIIDNTHVLVGSADFLSTSFSESINNTVIIESIPTITDPTKVTAVDVHTTMDAFIFDFEQMFNRGLFGGEKEPLYRNKFVDTGTQIEVYFGPTNNIIEQIVNQLNNADNILFYAVQQFTNGAMLNNMAIMNNRIEVLGVIDSITQMPPDIAEVIGSITYDGQGFNTMNHKYMVIDFPTDLFDYEYPSPSNLSDPVVITGSANWNESNFSRNDEVMIVIHDLAMTYMFGLIEFQSNVMGATQRGLIYGETRSAVNNVPLECTIAVRVERVGFLPGIFDDEPATTDSSAENGWYEIRVPGGLTDVTVTDVPDGFLTPNYIAGNQLLFPGGSQRIYWYLPLQPSSYGYGGGGGGGSPP